MTWIYGIKKFTSDDIGDNYGFVYMITCLKNNKKYIGKKWFWASRKKKIKGRKRAKRLKLESNWKTYYGSSEDLSNDVEKYGVDKFKRDILVLCKTKGDCSYHEARLIIEQEALLKEDYYNRWLSLKVHAGHLS